MQLFNKVNDDCFYNNNTSKLNWSKLLITIFLYFLFQIVLNIIVYFVNSQYHFVSDELLLYMNIVHNIFTIAIVFIVYGKKYLLSLYEAKQLVSYINKGIYWGIYLLLVNSILYYFINMLVNYFNLSIIEQTSTLVLKGLGTNSYTLAFVSFVITAPIAEELLFRGIIYKSLNTNFSFVFSSIISSLVFSALHFNLHYFFQLIVVGFILSYSFKESNSIVVPILAHALMNFLFFISWVS